MSDENTVLIAVYGTLRKGCYNHNRFSLPDPEAVLTVPGFDLYVDTGGVLPYAVVGEGQLVVELYQCPTSTARVIHSMERGAGYNSTTITTPLGIATLWTFPREHINHEYMTLESSGDYLKTSGAKRAMI